jgi:transcriptional regulator with XRE-family HTH domain
MLVQDHGFHLTQIARIERGESFSVPTLLRLAEAFQIPLEELIAGLEVVESSKKSSPKVRE